MHLDRMLELTQELVNARGPCGQEDEVRQVVLREMKSCCDRVWVDDETSINGAALDTLNQH